MGTFYDAVVKMRKNGRQMKPSKAVEVNATTKAKPIETVKTEIPIKPKGTVKTEVNKHDKGASGRS